MLLAVGSDHKTVKGEKLGILTGIMYLAPSNVSGLLDVCAYSTDGCETSCLNSAGRGNMNAVQAGRLRKTAYFLQNRAEFFKEFDNNVRIVRNRANKRDMVSAVRPNGTSDMPWERIMAWIFEKYGDVQFYDYTKYPFHKRADLPANYHLTYSYAEGRADEASENLANGRNVAMVFDAVPDFFKINGVEYPVINGDESDVRFYDPQGVIVGLSAKGRAKYDRTGFVVRTLSGIEGV